MKKLFLLFCISSILVSFTSFNFSEESIIGTWEIKSPKNTAEGEGFITFDKEGYILMEYGEEKMDGRSFEVMGGKATMSYTVDSKNQPIEIDFKTSIEAYGMTFTTKGIINFINKDKAQFAMGKMNESRPTEFTKENSTTLIRKK